ncbi:MAG: HAMP domain-containing protein [Nitrospinae bacterium]|nr:HAMP domain-containing protein [Nitrospinota bacterium]
MNFFTKGIKRKIVLSMIIVGIIPGAAAIMLTYSGGTRALKNSIGVNFQEIAREASDRIAMTIIDEIKRGEDIASVITAFNQNEKEIIAYLNAVTERNRQKYVNIILTRLQSPDSQILISEPYFNKEISNYSMNISIPVIPPLEKGAWHPSEGGIGGFGSLNITLNIEELFKVITDIRIGETGHANLITSDKTVLICPLYPPMSHTINNRLLKEISDKNSGWVIADDDAHGGEKSIVGFAQVKMPANLGQDSFGGKNWYIFIRQHPDETYTPMYSLLWKTSAAGVVLIGVLSLLGLTAANKIVNPVLELRKEAELIGNGNLDHRLRIETGDEIEDLSIAFNKMADDLKQNIEEIKRVERLASVGEMAAEAADRIRNPLSSILTAVELLNSSDGGLTEEERKSLIVVLKKETRRLDNILKDFINSAIPETTRKAIGNRQ